MSKLNKDIKETMAEAVIHVIATQQSKKSSYSMVEQGIRYANIVVIPKLSK